MREDIRARAALRTKEITHILDDAENGHFGLLKHRHPAAGVDQRQILRRRDDDCAGKRHVLRQSELGVAGARRHVDDEAIALAPSDFAEQLRQGRHDHRPAPHHRRRLFDEEADRHDGDAMHRDRLQNAAFEFRFAIDAEEPRHGGPVNVSVEQADTPAFRREAKRQICGESRLADAAFA